MLTISKPLSAGQAQSYHKNEFISEQQSYWSRGKAVHGEWQGRLTARYSLSGVVSEEAFARLSQGQHPQTGEQLVRHRLAHDYKDENGKARNCDGASGGLGRHILRPKVCLTDRTRRWRPSNPGSPSREPAGSSRR